MNIAYLSPVKISIAPLKLAMFQQAKATLKIHDNTAFLSSWVGCDTITWVIHEETCNFGTY